MGASGLAGLGFMLCGTEPPRRANSAHLPQEKRPCRLRHGCLVQAKICQRGRRESIPNVTRLSAGKALPGTITHMAARGSNAFIGQDLAQTMTFFTPDEVERLEVLNAWTGRSDLIRLHHWDQFNQTAGRNLGFRKSGDVRHDLLIGHRLLECLLGDGLGRSRYDLRLHLSRGRRYAVRLKAA